MAFGFLKLPFKLITAPVKFVASKVVAPAVRFVARNPEVILGTILGGVPGAVLSQVVPGFGGGGGGDPPTFAAVPGPEAATALVATNAPGADRFSLAQTFRDFLAPILAGARETVEAAASQVTVKPRLSGVTLALVVGAGIAGVLGLVVALRK